MGFFSKILKGLGFEEEENQPKPVKVKEKKQKAKQITASYDLNKEEKDKMVKEQKNVKEIEAFKEQEIIQNEQKPAFSLDIIKVSNQIEVQSVINRIKKGEKVLINLSNMSSQDMVRSLDFLSGAVYALDLVLQKVEGNVYLVQ